MCVWSLCIRCVRYSGNVLIFIYLDRTHIVVIVVNNNCANNIRNVFQLVWPRISGFLCAGVGGGDGRKYVQRLMSVLAACFIRIAKPYSVFLLEWIHCKWNQPIIGISQDCQNMSIIHRSSICLDTHLITEYNLSYVNTFKFNPTSNKYKISNTFY